jgi:3'-5' exoribonuclease
MADKGFFIATLPHDGVVTFLALVREKELKPKRNGGVYLHLVLADRTGEVDAKIWDTPEATSSLFDRDDIVKVRGTIELYNDRPQLIVQRVRRCEDGEFQEADFCPTSVHDPEEMFAELRGFVESVADANLRVLLVSILEDADVAGPLKIAPAAMRLHHAFRSGLLEHTVSLCGLAEAMVGRYPRLNRDLLIAGVILHDIARWRSWKCRVGWVTPREGSSWGTSRSAWRYLTGIRHAYRDSQSNSRACFSTLS